MWSWLSSLQSPQCWDAMWVSWVGVFRAPLHKMLSWLQSSHPSASLTRLSCELCSPSTWPMAGEDCISTSTMGFCKTQAVCVPGEGNDENGEKQHCQTSLTLPKQESFTPVSYKQWAPYEHCPWAQGKGEAEVPMPARARHITATDTCKSLWMPFKT